MILPSSIVELIEILVDTALNTSMNSNDKTGQSWQPWTDYLIYIVLIALPWGGPELLDSVSNELNNIFDKIQSYFEIRPIKFDKTLRPFLTHIKENDYSAEYYLN